MPDINPTPVPPIKVTVFLRPEEVRRIAELLDANGDGALAAYIIVAALNPNAEMTDDELKAAVARLKGA